MSYEKFIPQEFSGVVSVYRKDKCIFEKSYGYRDYPNNIENKVDTIFGTASAGKAFVAVAIMKLIENG
ncbi:MAG: serine hydrolase, partial [Bacillales bacterium]|nr:serine hydrolase [Bacillales bacterium]